MNKFYPRSKKKKDKETKEELDLLLDRPTTLRMEKLATDKTIFNAAAKRDQEMGQQIEPLLAPKEVKIRVDLGEEEKSEVVIPQIQPVRRKSLFQGGETNVTRRESVKTSIQEVEFAVKSMPDPTADYPDEEDEAAANESSQQEEKASE